MDTEAAIARYLQELEAEAELARDDLAELEDHLRSMIAELRATGASADVAIARARQRLGDPKQVAREHVRVRSPFGAKLSRARAWSASALMLVLLVAPLIQYGNFGGLRLYVELGIGVVLAIALAARLTWARAVIAGVMGFGLLHAVVLFASAWDLTAFHAGLMVIQLAVFAFVMPWRRGELGVAGLALASLAVMHMGATTVLMFEITSPVATIEMLGAQVALVATYVAGIGIVMRARWAAIAAAVSMFGLVMATVALSGLTFRFENASAVRAIITSTVVLGAVASTACALLAWRTARTTFGSLRGFAI